MAALCSDTIKIKPSAGTELLPFCFGFVLLLLCCFSVNTGILLHSVFTEKSPKPLHAKEGGLYRGVNTERWGPLACLSDIP